MGISFRKPDFGNSFVINNEAIVRKSMGGGTLVVVDPSWPNTTKLSCTISNLRIDQKDTFAQFFEAVAGQEIFFTDHENVTWKGFITTSKPEITQYGRMRMFKTSFEFEGVQV